MSKQKPLCKPYITCSSQCSASLKYAFLLYSCHDAAGLKNHARKLQHSFSADFLYPTRALTRSQEKPKDQVRIRNSCVNAHLSGGYMNVQKYLPQERESMQIRHSDESRERIIKRTFAGKKSHVFAIYLFPDVALFSPDVSPDVIESLF
jgi:hypothetical protein